MADKSNYRAADDAYESRYDNATEIPGYVKDDSYVTSDSFPIQIQSDSAPVDDPIAQPNPTRTLHLVCWPQYFNA
jgi:hypothetical protein